MPGIVPPVVAQPIVDGDGLMSQPFYTWANAITRNDPIVGTGSPEGVVEANQARLYMDDAGAAGAILYVKRDPAIAGDKSQGWILV